VQWPFTFENKVPDLYSFLKTRSRTYISFWKQGKRKGPPDLNLTLFAPNLTLFTPGTILTITKDSHLGKYP
jgi:hypothetical protein